MSLYKGSTILQNSEENARSVSGAIPIRYERRLNVNFVKFNGITGLSVSTARDQYNFIDVLDVKDFIYGRLNINEEREVKIPIYFITRIEYNQYKPIFLISQLNKFSVEVNAGKSVKVVLKGTWTIDEYNITGTLISVFDKSSLEPSHVQANSIFANVYNYRNY